MKNLLKQLLPILRSLCPKSRWGNIIYLALGIIGSNYDSIIEFVQAILAK